MEAAALTRDNFSITVEIDGDVDDVYTEAVNSTIGPRNYVSIEEFVDDLDGSAEGELWSINDYRRDGNEPLVSKVVIYVGSRDDLDFELVGRAAVDWTGTVTVLIATDGSGIARFVSKADHIDAPLTAVQIDKIFADDDVELVATDPDWVDQDEIDALVSRGLRIDDLDDRRGVAPGEYTIVNVKFPV